MQELALRALVERDLTLSGSALAAECAQAAVSLGDQRAYDSFLRSLLHGLSTGAPPAQRGHAVAIGRLAFAGALDDEGRDGMPTPFPPPVVLRSVREVLQASPLSAVRCACLDALANFAKRVPSHHWATQARGVIHMCSHLISESSLALLRRFGHKPPPTKASTTEVEREERRAACECLEVWTNGPLDDEALAFLRSIQTSLLASLRVLARHDPVTQVKMAALYAARAIEVVTFEKSSPRSASVSSAGDSHADEPQDEPTLHDPPSIGDIVSRSDDNAHSPEHTPTPPPQEPLQGSGRTTPSPPQELPEASEVLPPPKSGASLIDGILGKESATWLWLLYECPLDEVTRTPSGVPWQLRLACDSVSSSGFWELDSHSREQVIALLAAAMRWSTIHVKEGDGAAAADLATVLAATLAIVSSTPRVRSARGDPTLRAADKMLHLAPRSTRDELLGALSEVAALPDDLLLATSEAVATSAAVGRGAAHKAASARSVIRSLSSRAALCIQACK
jgi:hypothetical protein